MLTPNLTIVLVSKSADHDCEIGLPIKALIPLLSYDVLVNLAVTILYLAMANKVCHRLSWRNAFKLLLHALPFRNPGPLPSQGDLFELFMAKSVLACVAVVLGTVGNLVALMALNGHEEAWLCLTICSVDGMFPSLPYHPIRVVLPIQRSWACAAFAWLLRIYPSMDRTYLGMPVSWTVMVIHWLTSNVFRGAEAANLTTSPRARQLAGEYHEMH